MNFSFDNSKISAIEAQFEAQKIAFAPIIFQVSRIIRKWNILELLDKHKDGLTIEELSEKLNKKKYVLQILLETALSANIVTCKNDKFLLSKIGYFLQNDKMTNINLNFNHHINYIGMYNLEESLDEESPVGLKVFTDIGSIYPVLSTLPQEARNAWFDFDHFYSDGAFEEALDVLKHFQPKTILDIGGNTGKFSILCASKLPDVNICIVDLPEQIFLAEKNISERNLQNRIKTHSANVLSDDSLPNNFDIVWMSQFLDCFSEDEIIYILKKVAKSISKDSKVCILEPVWDRQKFEASSFCIINTSPYFTALANGKSKMFKSSDLQNMLEKSGFIIETIKDGLGFGHSLFTCKLK